MLVLYKLDLNRSDNSKGSELHLHLHSQVRLAVAVDLVQPAADGLTVGVPGHGVF